MSPRGPGLVIDTNVWISGLLLSTGAPAQIVRQAVTAGQPFFSQETFAELKDRLWRPKFDRYVTLEQRKHLLRDLESMAMWVEIPSDLAAQTFSRDATDDKFIHTALAAEVTWLVTGDKDLLVLAKRMLPVGLRILSPADVLKMPELSSLFKSK